ncbi:hypothetical protein NQ318_017648 [Aromia moschata]|uniref:Uncharacterized protein n=1 Tax=Aromia moschata TaxID=1265417 RepID=A0AAV8Z3M2_9CUCU|nr:hypothetical protein NQ318_017648 [Aromia moschata]
MKDCSLHFAEEDYFYRFQGHFERIREKISDLQNTACSSAPLVGKGARLTTSQKVVLFCQIFLFANTLIPEASTLAIDSQYLTAEFGFNRMVHGTLDLSYSSFFLWDIDLCITKEKVFIYKLNSNNRSQKIKVVIDDQQNGNNRVLKTAEKEARLIQFSLI